MNEIISKFLLAGDKFIPKMHLRQPYVLCKPGFTYSAFGSSTKNNEKSWETGDSKYIYHK